MRLWKGNKMKWILLFLISWIAYTVLLAFIGGFHEDDKGLYVICGAMCSGISTGIVFVTYLIVRLMV